MSVRGCNGLGWVTKSVFWIHPSSVLALSNRYSVSPQLPFFCLVRRGMHQGVAKRACPGQVSL
jgi:hypothetical protein